MPDFPTKLLEIPTKSKIIPTKHSKIPTKHEKGYEIIFVAYDRNEIRVKFG